ncbi:hypothetical protein FOA52_000298 [Chlamydomonas sp. UWO 241]|nr:hypothetical protein FOA52_000298 [Chlamydomonas sp. UWO 241]
MQTRRSAQAESDAIASAASASAHAVLLSQDLWVELQRWMDPSSKVALRSVSKAMRRQVDGAVAVGSSPASGFAAAKLAAALARWHAVRHLTLLAVAKASDLKPLATAPLSRLESLTIRQWGTTLSGNLGATLRTLDVGGCGALCSIDAVRSCVKLVCLRMPCVNVADLKPLTACSETLGELWLAGSGAVTNLAPLKACLSLRKLDLRGCNPELHSQVDDLQLTCTQLANPASVELEGLVHELQPNMKPDIRTAALEELADIAEEGRPLQEFVSAGAIPAVVRLLGPESTADMQSAAANVLQILASGHGDQVQTAIAVAGAIPDLVWLLEPRSCADVQEAAARALSELAFSHTQNQAAIAAAGAIPALVRLLGPVSSTHVQVAAARALFHLAADLNKDAITATGVVPVLVRLLRPGSSGVMQTLAAAVLSNLASEHAHNQTAIAAAGAIPVLVQRLETDLTPHVQSAMTFALSSLADNHAQNRAAIITAGAIPALVRGLGPESSAALQASAASLLCNLMCQNDAQDQAAAAVSAAIPALVQLLGLNVSARVQKAVAQALRNLTSKTAQIKAAITAAGAIPAAVQLLGSESSASAHAAAADVLRNLASKNADD